MHARSWSHSPTGRKNPYQNTHLNLKLNEIAFRLVLGIEETWIVEYLIEIEAICAEQSMLFDAEIFDAFPVTEFSS